MPIRSIVDMEGKRKTSSRQGAKVNSAKGAKYESQGTKGNSATGAKYESQGQALSGAKRVAPG
jgi:hypothetical protein